MAKCLPLYGGVPVHCLQKLGTGCCLSASICAYAGAIIAHNAGINDIVGITVCWVGLFAPGILLIFGIFPWWASFRNFQIYRRCSLGWATLIARL